MKKAVLASLTAILLLSSCAKEFNAIYKSQDYRYKYEYAITPSLDLVTGISQDQRKTLG